MLVGTILWASVLKSGVHATLAGVIIGFCIPLKGKMAKPRYMTLNIFLPLVILCYPAIIRFCQCTGVSFDGIDSSMLSSPLLFAISLGLIIGKPLGVFGFSYLSVKLGIAKLPQGINFKQILPWRFYVVSVSPCQCS